MPKPIEIERQSVWGDLRRKVHDQAINTTQTYHVGTRVDNAVQAVHGVARKYGFKVSVKPDTTRRRIIVWRGENKSQ